MLPLCSELCFFVCVFLVAAAKLPNPDISFMLAAAEAGINTLQVFTENDVEDLGRLLGCSVQYIVKSVVTSRRADAHQ